MAINILISNKYYIYLLYVLSSKLKYRQYFIDNQRMINLE